MVEFYPKITSDYSSYLSDESGIITNGSADGIYFPKNEIELEEIVNEANRTLTPITLSGGGTGLSGGRVPLNGWIIATDKMCSISQNHNNVESWLDEKTGVAYEFNLEIHSDESATITLPIALPLFSFQRLLRSLGWFFGPDPTERTAFLGGNVSTNASGARSFKYGSMRNWVEKIHVILPTGEKLVLDRNENYRISNDYINIHKDDNILKLPRPKYKIPNVTKHTAGPVITNKSNVLDLFIGSDGIFGVLSEISLAIIRPPKYITNLFVFFSTMEDALNLVKYCQELRENKDSQTPMSVEFLDNRAIKIMKTKDANIPANAYYLIMLEIDSHSDDQLEQDLEYWNQVFDHYNVVDTSVALEHTEIEHHKELRHFVPETINQMVRSNGQPKIGTDFSVPLQYIFEIFKMCEKIGKTFEEQLDLQENEFGYALWAHAGDAHLHLNLIPKTADDTIKAKQVVVNLLQDVVRLGGSVAAEHGIGKKKFGNTPFIVLQYDEKAYEDLLVIKKLLDPKLLLNKGNLLN